MSEALTTPAGAPVVVGRPLEPGSAGPLWATSDPAVVLARPCPVPAARLKTLLARPVPLHRPDGRLVLRWPTAAVLDEGRRLAGCLLPAVDPTRTVALTLAANPAGRALHPWLKAWTWADLLRTAVELTTLAAVLEGSGLDLGDPFERDVQVWPDGAVTLLDAVLLADGRSGALGPAVRRLLLGDGAAPDDLLGPELPLLLSTGAPVVPAQLLDALARAQWHLTTCLRGHVHLADVRGCPWCHYGL